MQWTAIVATAIGAIIGVSSTLVAERIRWRRDTAERDRDALRASFMEYLTALAHTRDAFSRAEPSIERIGHGHVAMAEHGLYASQQHLELVATQQLVESANRATLTILEFHDVVAAGHSPNTTEYIQAWRSIRNARQHLIHEMQAALRRS
ncbi:hypothetical protein [Streptomyces sp. NPDC058623]|uniref:hypothetical protein n=1 Tax=Streptomyces sp. NPDC058623 TaxID=3346563 RepID=UPI003667E9CF